MTFFDPPDTGVIAAIQAIKHPWFGRIMIIATQCPSPLGMTGALHLAILPFTIGISRIHLGAHYPTDVVGGWAIGLAGLVPLTKVIGV